MDSATGEVVDLTTNESIVPDYGDLIISLLSLSEESKAVAKLVMGSPAFTTKRELREYIRKKEGLQYKQISSIFREMTKMFSQKNAKRNFSRKL